MQDRFKFMQNFRLNRYAMIFWVKQLINPYFHMNIPCDRIFFLLLNLFTLTFDLFLNKIDIGHQSFHIACEHFLGQDLSTGFNISVMFILAIFGISNYHGLHGLHGHLCFTNTFCLALKYPIPNYQDIHPDDAT